LAYPPAIGQCIHAKLEIPEAWGVVVNTTPPVFSFNKEAITVGVTLEAVG
jgi:hypothetical protein